MAELANAVSLCEMSRDHGGELGWVSPEDYHLDDKFPEELRKAALMKKPGDLYLETSRLGTHIVHVDDVFQTLTPTLRRRAPKIHNPDVGYAQPRTPLGELLGTDQDLTYSMETMGCQMNAADSERMAGTLEEMGLVRHPDDADKKDFPNVVVINTCSIRDHAEQKVYSILGPYAARKRRGEPVAIVVAGCVAQQEGGRLLRRFPEIDAVIGPQYANRLGEVLESAMEGNQVVAVEPAFISEDVTKPRRDSSVCAWVNIIYGCNERCTYCVVPGTRGVEQSRTPDAIVKEIQGLGEQDFREVTLLGQNIDAYGRDMSPKRRFADLMRTIDEYGGAPSLARVRFATSHPRYMSDDVVDTIASSIKGSGDSHGRLMPVFHIPAQSGSDKVLREMGRGYTKQRYMQIVDRINRYFPTSAQGHVAITSDFIVGFPGETEEEFQETLQLMEEVKFSSAMCAAYSPRPNTPAALWENQVPENVKERRLKEIQALQEKHALFRSTELLDTEQEILVEGPNPKDATQVVGRTPTNRLTYFPGDAAELTGKIVRVRITEARPFTLSGERVGTHAY
uniref:Uncharacterized protein n=1 Tax=Phaeomonas parva TaxID=124430 RepID=A0A7S1TZH7_9STRA